VSDPCTLDIDGFIVGLTSTDVLFHLGAEEISGYDHKLRSIEQHGCWLLCSVRLLSDRPQLWLLGLAAERAFGTR